MKTSKILFATIIALCACMTSAQPISARSKLLTQCEISYSYLGQLMQLRNNEGAAKAMVRRSTMMTTTNFMLNEENGAIAAWKIREFTMLRDPLKRDFDSGAKSPFAAVEECDQNAMPIAIAMRGSAKILWGKSFDELQGELFDKARKSLGL